MLFERIFTRFSAKTITQYQNELAARQLAEVQNLYCEMRAWKHDYHSHMQMMKAYLASGELDRLDAYIDELSGDLTAVDTIVKSGNVAVDAILNSKLSLARTRRIDVHAAAVVPERIAVEETDLCVLLSNLLDNAMEGCAAAKTPFIRVYIGMKKQNLYLSVTNSTVGKPKRVDNRFVTSKSGFHGFGLSRIDRIVEKYGGILTRAGETDGFTTEILLPV